MIDRYTHNPTAYDDDWEDQPGQGWFYKWVLGVAVPLGIAACSVFAIATQESTFMGRESSMTLHGRNRVALDRHLPELPLLLGQHL